MVGWFDALLQEVSADPPVAETIVRILFRLVVAALLGGLLGYDRERAGKVAGLRTHMLVCVGSALFVLGARGLGMTAEELSRVIQGISAGSR